MVLQMKRFYYLIVTLLTLTSCQQAKQKGQDLFDHSKAKVKEKAVKYSAKAFDKIVDFKKTRTEIASFEKVFGDADSLNIKELEGLRIDFTIGFYAYFLVYKAEKNTVLNYISSLPTKLPHISDKTINKTDSLEILTTLHTFRKEKYGLNERLEFFFELEEKTSLEFYHCSKYPLNHSIAYDSNTGYIYHHMENYWD